jgi:hypothetical protein
MSTNPDVTFASGMIVLQGLACGTAPCPRTDLSSDEVQGNVQPFELKVKFQVKLGVASTPNDKNQ